MNWSMLTGQAPAIIIEKYAQDICQSVLSPGAETREFQVNYDNNITADALITCISNVNW